MNSEVSILIIIAIIFALIFAILLIWSLCSIISISQNISLLRELEYKKYNQLKSGSRETPDGEEPQ